MYESLFGNPYALTSGVSRARPRAHCQVTGSSMHAVRRWIVAAVAVLIAAMPVAAGDPPTDAISREVSVHNDLQEAGPGDAISREVSLFNQPPSSAEFATDSISREVSVFSDHFANAPPTDAISREVSVEDIIHCTGDFTGDFAVTTDDIAAFAHVLTGFDNHPARRDAADINCDGVPNAKDIQPFVDAILAP